MKNFLLIANNLDVMPLLHAVQRQPDLWNRNDLRTSFNGSPHRHVSDIWLRYNEIPQENMATLLDEPESVNYPAMFALPEARPIIFGLMARLQGERLGACVIAKLPAGRSISAHTDEGTRARYYDRYHVVLHAAAGCAFRIEDEAVQMRTGETWWIDNTHEHEVINNSSDDRIHLIVDIRNAHP